MDILLHDERVHVVLQQLPRFLSTTVPLADKLRELCDAAVGVLEVDGAAAVLLRQDISQVVHSAAVPAEVLETLGDRDAMRELVASAPDARPLRGQHGMVVGLRNEHDVYGVLYVAPHDPNAGFTADELSIVELFAAAVGPVIHHGLRTLVTEQAERWSAAAVRLMEQFLAAEVEDPYASLVDVVWELDEADVVLATAMSGRDHVIAAARGMGFEEFAGHGPFEPSPLGDEVTSGTHSTLVEHIGDQSTWLRENRPDLAGEAGPLMAVPLQGAKGPLGVLFLVRRAGAPRFTDEDQRIAERFAVNAALSMEWHAARRTHDELQMLQERNRIARDLHDNVVQRLFATGLYLQQAARTLEGDAKERVEGAMTAVDQTIRQIRNTILVLRSTASDRLDNLLTTIVAETTPLLGFSPKVSMAPDISQIAGPLAADLALCVREALSNVVQHARATAVELVVSIEDSVVVMRISDNGVGITGDRRPGGGLENLDERARAHGGTFTYTGSPGEGTTLSWRMPLATGG